MRSRTARRLVFVQFALPIGLAAGGATAGVICFVHAASTRLRTRRHRRR